MCMAEECLNKSHILYNIMFILNAKEWHFKNKYMDLE